MYLVSHDMTSWKGKGRVGWKGWDGIDMIFADVLPFCRCAHVGCPLTEDHEWRLSQVAAGPAQQDALAAEARQGVLWEYYR